MQIDIVLCAANGLITANESINQNSYNLRFKKQRKKKERKRESDIMIDYLFNHNYLKQGG